MDIPRPNRSNRRLYLWGGLAVAVVVAVTVAVSRLEPAAPVVRRATVYTDTVKRGPLVRQVRGPGSLVPRRILWVSALTAGRVEEIRVQPGGAVAQDSVLLVLDNRDVALEALQAQGDLTAAEAELAHLRARLHNQILSQQGVVGGVRADAEDARRRLEANEELNTHGLIPGIDLEHSRSRAAELASRLEIEQQRLESLQQAVDAQLAAEATKVERFRAIAEFQEEEAASLTVRAGIEGVLQELPLEVGQWITPGTTVAKVVQPHDLKAVLRIPETQAKDLRLGLSASIDTRNGIVEGQVARIDPAVQNGTVTVDVTLDGQLPSGARPDLSVEGVVQIERLEDVLYVGRPAYGQAHSVVGLFRVDPDDQERAVRVAVRLGRSSVNTVEIVEGLKEGDEVILSDLSSWEAFDRIRLQ
jgi:HlyD family secretion protein